MTNNELLIQDYTELINHICSKTDAAEAKTLYDSISRIAAIIDNDDIISEYFDYIGKSTFKACFDLSEHYVIKFTAKDSVFYREADLYDALSISPYKALIAETYYLPLPAPLYDPIIKAIWNPLIDAVPEGCEDGFTALIIQEKVDTPNIDLLLKLDDLTINGSTIYDLRGGHTETAIKATHWGACEEETRMEIYEVTIKYRNTLDGVPFSSIDTLLITGADYSDAVNKALSCHNVKTIQELKCRQVSSGDGTGMTIFAAEEDVYNELPKKMSSL